MKIKCPVCEQSMNSLYNNNTYICVKKEEYIPELKVKIEYIHATVYLDDSGKQIVKNIDILPYTFQIIDQDEVKQTRIMKVTNPAFKKRNSNGFYDQKPTVIFGSFKMEQETLIVVPNAINIQWNDKKQVEERVKMYMLFS